MRGWTEVGLYILIQHEPPTALRLSEPTQRVCAWCGAVEPMAKDAIGATTHGLCRSCLEKRTGGPERKSPEPESESGCAEDESSSCE